MKSLQTTATLSFLAIISFCAFCPAGEPIAHWTFDEGSGTTAYDSAGDHDGTITGATWTEGLIGGALSFDGNNDYVRVPNSSAFNFPAGFTLCAWTKPALSSLDARLVYRHDPAANSGYSIGQTTNNSGAYYFGPGVNGVGAPAISNVHSVVGQWAYVVGVRENNGDVKIYIDGVLQSNITNLPGAIGSIADLFIGVDYALSKDFKGVIDDVRIYNYALDANEVQELYAQGCPAGEPIAHWTFDEGSGTTAHDSAGSHNGIITGATWTEGRIGGALSFDGTNDYVAAADNDNSLDMDNQITIAAWIKPNNLNKFYCILAKQPSGTASSNYPGNYEFRIIQTSGILQLLHQTGTGTTYTGYNSTIAVTAGVWQHVAVTLVEGESVNFYVNGVPAGTFPHNEVFGIVNNEPVRIGTRKDSNYWFNGAIDEVRIYNYALDANEVAELYDAEIPDLQSIEIAGPNSVPEESDSQYQVIGHYDNGSSKDVTADANLMVAPDEFAVIELGGILETFRLYRMQETCTIYAECQGFTALKPVKIYPVCDGNECTQQQLLNRNIADTIQIKQDIMDDLEYAMKIERASIQMLAKMPWNQKPWGHLFKPCPPGQLNKARIHLLAALVWEQWADRQIDKSVDSLEDTLELLQLEKPGNGKK